MTMHVDKADVINNHKIMHNHREEESSMGHIHIMTEHNAKGKIFCMHECVRSRARANFVKACVTLLCKYFFCL